MMQRFSKDNVMMKRIVVLCGGVLLLGACSGAKEQLGLNRQVPDEFKVVTHAPLELPPSYTLRPPAPGAPRPQEQNTIDAASEAVFGEAVQNRDDVTNGEAALLQAAGGNAVNPNIRDIVDGEAGEVDDSNKPVAERLLNLSLGRNTESQDIIDAQAERERLELEEAAKNALKE